MIISVLHWKFVSFKYLAQCAACITNRFRLNWCHFQMLAFLWPRSITFLFLGFFFVFAPFFFLSKKENSGFRNTTFFFLFNSHVIFRLGVWSSTNALFVYYVYRNKMVPCNKTFPVTFISNVCLPGFLCVFNHVFKRFV